MKKIKSAKKAAAKKQPVKKAPVAKKPIEGVEKRNFILMSMDGNDVGRYTGRAPRQAALKAANRGIKDIILREAGRRKVIVKRNERVVHVKLHYFKGDRATRSKTKADPEWMNDPVSFPIAEKMGSYWVPIHETNLIKYLGV
jgi:hypothetical protein